MTGLLVIDKPAGLTSMRVVEIVRRRAGGTKTGHAGTLDPLATGVLVLALGRATKMIDRIMTTEKRYTTEIDLSAFTSTDDLEGPREEIAVQTPPDAHAIRQALEQFVGEFDQRPPDFSAVKVAGRRAYKHARAGETLELPSRRVTIHDITLKQYDWPIVTLDVHCAKGVYIRSLARDLGAALGVGGHCRSIRRTAVGPFTLDEAWPLDDVPEPLSESDLLPVSNVPDSA
mgnify:CR=1 FL=1